MTKVFVSIMGTESERAATFDGLKSTASYLRSRIGKSLQLQFAPEIAFRVDESVARAAHIETLLAGLREPPAPDGTPDVAPEATDG